MKHLFSILFTVFTSLGLFATVHTVSNSGTTFSPSTLNITQGDTVNWSIAGSHNVIEVGMATWTANDSTSNGGFSLPLGGGQHIFTSTGTFYYVCGPHAAGGMKATITVAAAPPTIQMDLPVTFEDATINYSTIDFGGNASSFVLDPTGGINMVVQSVKGATAQLWAGTTLGVFVAPGGPTFDIGFATAIPMSSGNTSMSVRVYSPDAGIPVRLKIEDSQDATKSVETEAMTTTSGTWETLVFDFSNEASGTAAINYTYTFDKASIFFNFGTDGATAGVKTYYWDDVEFVTAAPPVLAQMDLPVTFDDTATVNYATVDFGGNASIFVVDPIGGTNLVVESTKGAAAQLWAGTTLDAGAPNGFATAIPFTATETSMSVRVYSPDAGIPVRLKVEDKTNPTISAETEAMTTGVNTWEVLTFDFITPAAGTAALNIANTYDMASIFFNFGTDGATAGVKTYYWDDVEFVTAAPPVLAQMDLPVSFDLATVNYSTVDFGGNASSFVIDPVGGTNKVVKSTKSNTAALWAGTTLAVAGPPDVGFLNAIPFTATATTMSVRVYSPDSGIPVRLKVEDETDPTKSVETEAMTTGVNTWETLIFDFSSQATGTAALDLGFTYDKASIFFNFGTDGMTAGVKTYYWDDVKFGGATTNPCVGVIGDPLILDDFECQGNITYTFENATWTPNIPNPNPTGANTSSMVGEFIHWGAGTDGAFGGSLNLGPISLSTNNQLKIDVHTNATAIPITVVMQDAALNTVVESVMTTSTMGAWETLTFDMSSASTATNIANIVIVVNPGTNVQDTLYIDNVRLDGFAINPCETAVPNKDIMEDFDCQRNIDHLFAEGGFITIANPDMSGINTSNNIGQYTRNNTVADAFGGDFILAPLDFATNNQVKMNIWDANAPSEVTIVLQDASGADVGNAVASSTTANVWEDLNFDFSGTPDAAGVSKVVILFDAGVKADSGQVYFFDNLRMDGFVTGITEINSTVITVYPNPVNDFINVNVSELKDTPSFVISIYSIDGKLIKEFNETNTNNELYLDINEISSGFYLLEVEANNKKHITKFVKK
jgi:plastocyanin